MPHFKTFVNCGIAFKSMVLGKVLGNCSSKATLPLLKKKKHVCLVGFDRCSGFIESPIFISPGKKQKLSQYCVESNTAAEKKMLMTSI